MIMKKNNYSAMTEQRLWLNNRGTVNKQKKVPRKRLKGYEANKERPQKMSYDQSRRFI